MYFKHLKRIAVTAIAICLITACQKNTAQTASRNLTANGKEVLLAKVKADTLFKQWNNNQVKVVEAYAGATQQPGFDMQKLQSQKPKNDDEMIAALKAAGATNAEEILALNKRSMQLLKDLWKKYPDLDKLSHDELLALNVKTQPNLKQ